MEPHLKKIPTHLIKGTSKGKPAQVKVLSEIMQNTGKNLHPVIIIEVKENEYQVIAHDLIWQATKAAKLDFTWCLIISSSEKNQILMELGEKTPITEPGTTDLNSLSVAQLKELAKSQGIKGYSKLNKAQLLKLFS